MVMGPVISKVNRPSEQVVDRVEGNIGPSAAPFAHEQMKEGGAASNIAPLEGAPVFTYQGTHQGKPFKIERWAPEVVEEDIQGPVNAARKVVVSGREGIFEISQSYPEVVVALNEEQPLVTWTRDFGPYVAFSSVPDRLGRDHYEDPQRQAVGQMATQSVFAYQSGDLA